MHCATCHVLYRGASPIITLKHLSTLEGGGSLRDRHTAHTIRDLRDRHTAHTRRDLRDRHTAHTRRDRHTTHQTWPTWLSHSTHQTDLRDRHTAHTRRDLRDPHTTHQTWPTWPSHSTHQTPKVAILLWSLIIVYSAQWLVSNTITTNDYPFSFAHRTLNFNIAEADTILFRVSIKFVFVSEYNYFGFVPWSTGIKTTIFPHIIHVILF
jgi:hypothetical protein